MTVQPSGSTPVPLPCLSLHPPARLNPSGLCRDLRARHRNHHVPIPGWVPMNTRLRARMVATVLILSVAGLPVTAQAGDAGTDLVVQSRPADSPQTQGDARSMRATAESSTSKASTQPAIQECDGQPSPAGALTTFLNRVRGRTLPENVRLCPPPPDNETAPDIANK